MRHLEWNYSDSTYVIFQNFFGPEFVKMTIEPYVCLDLPRSILVSNKNHFVSLLGNSSGMLF